MKDEEIVNLFWGRLKRAIEETQKEYQKYCAYISGNILSNREDVAKCANEVSVAT